MIAPQRFRIAVMLRHALFWSTTAAFCFVPSTRLAAEDPSRETVLAAMKKASSFYRLRVAVHGGYVYYSSVDGAARFGEGAASPTQIWVQPPGTPTVGEAYLAAHSATEDAWYLEAATETAMALAYGQLKSGGWTNSIDFDPASKAAGAYRNGKGRGKDHSTLDDDITQSALAFLMKVDRAHRFQHSSIHDAARVGLDALLAAQFPNGGFPQVWTGPSEDRPVRKAQYPDYDWRTENRVKSYWEMYTLNDDLAGHVAKTLQVARDVYDDPRAMAALRKLGDFLILAQMPEPQPAWAQQYDVEMRPIWARKFEPPAITGRESQDAIETLLAIFEATGDEKYLKPIPSAIAYLQRSLLADGRLARYYELKTNKPLYMTASYELTHDDAAPPSHYSWKVDSRLPSLKARFERRTTKPAQSTDSGGARPDADRIRQILDELDAEGRWLSLADGSSLVGQPKFRRGDRFLSSERFSRNLSTLARFVAAGNDGNPPSRSSTALPKAPH